MASDDTVHERRTSAWGFLAIVAIVPLVDAWYGAWPLEEGLKLTPGTSLLSGAPSRSLETALERRSFVTNNLRPYVAEALYLLFGEVSPKVVVGRDGFLFLAGTILHWTDEELDGRLSRLVPPLSDLVSWFSRRGTKVVIAIVPNKTTFHADRLPPGITSTVVYPRLVGAMAKRGLRVVDLMPALRRAKEPYLQNDTHWTSAGAWECAKAVAVEARRMFPQGLPGRHLDGLLMITGPEPQRGDVLRFLGFRYGGSIAARFSSYNRRLIVVDRETMLRVTTDTAEPVVLAGTSFSKSRDFGALLAMALGRRVRARYREGYGPGATLLWLAEEVARGIPAPELVVWESPERHLLDERLPTRIAYFLANERAGELAPDPNLAGD